MLIDAFEALAYRVAQPRVIGAAGPRQIRPIPALGTLVGLPCFRVGRVVQGIVEDFAGVLEPDHRGRFLPRPGLHRNHKPVVAVHLLICPVRIGEELRPVQLHRPIGVGVRACAGSWWGCWGGQMCLRAGK
ncbi:MULTISPECIES: hypothetical protein [Nocardia]|uniref:hypothetical protein n=1 Tax=Nocardia TaxID=1817 RepID=UPI00157442B2|nr:MULTISPECIES: hypothetical protein [Nocardia]